MEISSDLSIIIMLNAVLMLLFIMLALKYTNYWSSWNKECRSAYLWLVIICFVTGVTLAVGITVGIQETYKITKTNAEKEITNEKV